MGETADSEPRVMVSVQIDQAAWEEANLTPCGADYLLGWALVIAGESLMDGKTSGSVFTGNDGGANSPHVGSWRAY
ncbi:hypothetical protein [Mycobacterium sp. NPDC050853]|uniref:hypothetical protein n=1 Tax=Mycobacterium sp. NPDC050853 TaxID=3155160 RepID=UPI0033EC4CE6